METVIEKLTQLGSLAQETSGSSFSIYFRKEQAKWIVNFTNSTAKEKPKIPKDFEEAIDDAIYFLLNYRKKKTLTENFTLYK